MYFIGMNPIPDEKNPPGNIISEIRRARDACILLGGHRTYRSAKILSFLTLESFIIPLSNREFPSSWMKRHIEAAGMRVVSVNNFTILHSEDSALRQVRVAKSKLEYMTDVNLRKGMESYLLDLEERARVAIRSNNGRIPLSFDYIIAAENANEENSGIVVDETNSILQQQSTHDHPLDVEAGSDGMTAHPPRPPSETASETTICGTS